ncbi:MAG TPA: cytochrome c oxidase subunit II [Ktedonobacterales bacterium]|nr:cytochrome c oxidase subunit II [Ktedonobacterales bacterium]
MNEPRHLLRATIIWLVATIVGLAIAWLIGTQLVDWGTIPAIASNRATDVDQVLGLFTLLSIPVFMLVVVFGGYAVFQFRSQGRPDRDGPATRGHMPTQVTWVVISIILVVFLFGYGLVFYNQIQSASASDVLVVHVNGEQWLWNYSYPQYGDNAYSTTLVLPVNRPVRFDITSTDVQHSFWIPAFAVKQDAVPGQTTHISATPTQLGTYEVRCAELCGVYHSYMETPVQVVTPDFFDSWIATLQAGQSARISSPVNTLAWMARDADTRSYSAREGWAA